MMFWKGKPKVEESVILKLLERDMTAGDIKFYGEQLAQNPFLNHIFTIMEEDASRLWKATPPTDVETREMYYLFIRVLGTIKGRIQTVIGEALGAQSQAEYNEMFGKEEGQENE